MFKRLKNGKSDSLKPKYVSRETISWALVIKLAACLLVLCGAMAAFSFACREIMNNFVFIFTPLAEENIGRLIRLGIWAFLFSVSVCAAAILVRPLWLIAAGSLATAAIYGLICGPADLAVWITAGLGGILILSLSTRAAKELSNQLKFSFRPLARVKLPLSFILSILVAVTVGLGYIKDSAQRHYLIPAEIKAPIVNMAVSQLKGVVEAQQIPAEQKQAMVAAAELKVKEMIEGVEKQVQPFAYALPYIFGAIAFFLFQTVFWLAEIVSLLFLRLLLPILRLTHFANFATETREVKYLTLSPVPAESKDKS